MRNAWLVVAALAIARPGNAQQPSAWDWRAVGLSRTELTSLLARYQRTATSSAYSDAMRRRAAFVVDSIQSRLAEGDLRVGDRVRLLVDGQASLSDSFAVTAGPALVLPVVGSVGLKGVLRSELATRLTNRVDSVYRGATVRVTPLTRIAVLGGVTKAGFYSLPKDALVADALSAAGGIAPTARLTDIYVERGRDRILGVDSIQAAMRDGRTIGDLRLIDGDRIVVPVKAEANALATVQVLSYVMSLSLTVLSLSKIF